MPRSIKKIPKFTSEDQERAFWAHADVTDYLDFRQARRATLPKLKPSSKTIAVRIPEYLLDNLRRAANKRDVPYQSFLKVIVAEHLAEEERPIDRTPVPHR